MPEQQAALYTLGQIADELRFPIHTVRYIIRTRRIEPACRVGNIRAFSAAAIVVIRQAGEKIARDKLRQGRAV